MLSLPENEPIPLKFSLTSFPEIVLLKLFPDNRMPNELEFAILSTISFSIPKRNYIPCSALFIAVLLTIITL